MFGSRIVVADEDPIFRKSLKDMLQKGGYLVTHEVGDGQSAIRAIRSVEPDLVILNAQLPVTEGIEVAKIVEESHLAPVILIANRSRQNLLEQAKKTSAMAFLVKPISELNLFAAIELALANYEKVTSLQKEVTELKNTLASRKVIEKAKGLLMNRLGINEEGAFKKLQQQSMKTRTSMKSVAEAIIVAYEVENK